MNIDDCYELGHVVKTHGLRGELVVVLDVDEPELYEDLDAVFIEINRTLVPFQIDELRLQGNRAIIRLEDVPTIENAAPLVGCALYLPLENLPELEEGQFYYHDIVGYTVTDQQRGHLGEISNVYELPHQHVAAVMVQGKEVLIPIADAIVTHVDHQKRAIHVALPDGLLEVYLDESKDY